MKLICNTANLRSDSLRCVCDSTFVNGFGIPCLDYDIEFVGAASGAVGSVYLVPLNQDCVARLQRSQRRPLEDTRHERLALLSQDQRSDPWRRAPIASSKTATTCNAIAFRRTNLPQDIKYALLTVSLVPSYLLLAPFPLSITPSSRIPLRLSQRTYPHRDAQPT